MCSEWEACSGKARQEEKVTSPNASHHLHLPSSAKNLTILLPPHASTAPTACVSALESVSGGGSQPYSYSYYSDGDVDLCCSLGRQCVRWVVVVCMCLIMQ